MAYHYTNVTLFYSLLITQSSVLDLISFSDVDWVNSDDSKSTNGFCVLFGAIWSSKCFKQQFGHGNASNRKLYPGHLISLRIMPLLPQKLNYFGFNSYFLSCVSPFLLHPKLFMIISTPNTCVTMTSA